MNMDKLSLPVNNRGKLMIFGAAALIVIGLALLSTALISRSLSDSTSASAGKLATNPGVVGVVTATATAFTQTSPCPPDWYNSPDATLRDRCAREKGTVTARQQASEQQTAQARATAYPPAPLPSVAAYSSPRPAILPEPESAKTIKLVDWGTDLAGDHLIQCMVTGATSIWLDGSVPNDGYTSWDRLFVVTRPGNAEHTTTCTAGERSEVIIQTNPTLETLVRNNGGSEKKYLHTWTSPKAVKTLQITGIVNSGRPGLDGDGDKFMGLNSIIYFKTGTGETGSFDMTTQTWHFGP